jgi:hypothetical protein
LRRSSRLRRMGRTAIPMRAVPGSSVVCVCRLMPRLLPRRRMGRALRLPLAGRVGTQARSYRSDSWWSRAIWPIVSRFHLRPRSARRPFHGAYSWRGTPQVAQGVGSVRQMPARVVAQNLVPKELPDECELRSKGRGSAP